MGEVYAATRVVDGLEAAVKVMHADALADPRRARRFQRELRMAAAIDSPHVVRVLEVGSARAPLPYLAMERLRGCSLGSALGKRERLAPTAVVELAEHVARGLEAARRAGVVHRDLKPTNLFRADAAVGAHEGHGNYLWKILDFGASTEADDDGTLTRGRAVGTPGYMAPEQARGAAVDHRADIHALAACLYRALTGQPAFSGADPHAILYAVVHKMPAQPSSVAPLPLAVDAVLAVGLAKDPGQRYARATELADDLAAAVAGSLSSTTRDRADAVLRRHPWGASR